MSEAFPLVHNSRAGHEPNKRRKVALACDRCRQTKRKCDGSRPVCAACAAKRPPTQCTWSAERANNPSYVEALEARIRELEQTKGSTSHAGPATSEGDSISPSSQAYSHAPNVQKSISQNAGNLSVPPVLHATSLAINENNHEAEELRVDAMGASSSYIMYPERGADQPSSNYFGPSSTASFLSLVRHIISRSGSPLTSRPIQNELPRLDERPANQTTPLALQHMASRYNTSAFHIPPRREADALIASYWTWVHNIYPVLHRPSFDQRYQALWQWQTSGSPGTTLDDVLFHCRLNAVFAQGAHFQSDVEPADRKKISESFFLRAQHLLTMDLLAHANLEMVQSLVLMAQYLQSTDKPNYCWSIAGLAVRLAQAIGLHLESTQDEAAGRKVDQVDIEVRRRVWASCILLDRVLSMIYGRPLMMHPQVTRRTLHLPSPIDDEYLTRYPDPPGMQPDGVPSLMACYSQTLRLQEILGEMLTAFYQEDQVTSSSSNASRRPTEVSNSTLVSRIKAGDFQDLFRLDGKLSSWYESLPAFLRLDEDGVPLSLAQSHSATSLQSTDNLVPSHIIFARQANALRTRWLHLRLFLFRPALLVVLDQDQYAFSFGPGANTGSDKSVLHRKMLNTLADLCVLAAEDLVNIIYRNSISEMSALSAWWYNVFYLHNCAIVILIALQCPSLQGMRQESDLKKSWIKCLHGLEGYKKYSDVAKRSHRVLQMIDGQIFGQQYDRQQPSAGIVRSLGESPSGENGMDFFSGSTVNNALVDPFAPYNWSTGVQPDIAGAIPGGDFWMGDSGDVSWLSVMPFVTGTNTS